MTGILKVSEGESRINGTLLGRKTKNGDDPYGAATSFLENHNCFDGDCVTVTGNQDADAFYIDTAKKEALSECKAATAIASKRTAEAPTTTESIPQTVGKKKRKRKGKKTSKSRTQKKAGSGAKKTRKGSRTKSRSERKR